ARSSRTAQKLARPYAPRSRSRSASWPDCGMSARTLSASWLAGGDSRQIPDLVDRAEPHAIADAAVGVLTDVVGQDNLAFLTLLALRSRGEAIAVGIVLED